MNKVSALTLAQNSVGFSRTMCDYMEFLLFLNPTEGQKQLLTEARKKLVWDVRYFNKLSDEMHHEGDSGSLFNN